ncbi:zinc metalloprotease [Flavisolibacter sp. BT320]|nr:zinc metalloprotease [Flavisolibacter longurius]
MRKITPFAIGCLMVIAACQKADVRHTSPENENPDVSLQSASSNESGIAAQRRCAAHDVLQRQLAADPERGRRLEALERIIQERSATLKGKPGSGGGGTPTGLITIPVVVHVVMRDPNSVTDQQISSQLAVLNADFQKKNAELTNSSVYLAGYTHGNVANCNIAFTLQSTVRKETSVSTFSTNDAVKFTSQGGSNAVNATTALNLWVCDLGGGVLGYAQFPGGNAATDGVVIDYQAFGTTGSKLYPEFNKGRTATHEVGHWLNLRHIWGDSRCGNDYAGDTPLHDGPNYGNPAQTESSFCKGNATPDMWMNYMDYSDDKSLYMFTANQKERMDLTLANARKSYYTAAN